YRNKLKTTKYAIDTEKVAEYFPSEEVFKGLLNVASTLYGIEFKDTTTGATDLWHPDVKKVEVDDKATGKMLGTMYFDLFPRPNKYTHAACWALVGRRLLPDGTVQLPVSALVCNFTPPTKDKPSLLPHDEVETLFHEFGHGLHNILSEATIARFSGTSVERDFVEAPSQMFENWVWDPKVLGGFAKHYKTGEPLPEKLLKAMIAAKNVGSGIDTEGQEAFGILDQRLHTVPGGTIDSTKAWIQGLGDVTLFPGIEGTYPQASFGHLMGGYQAGYYGYLWSKVYAADMFSRFEQNGLMNPEAGQYYRSRILARGSSMDAGDMLRDYLGREPKLDAFLRDLGLSTEVRKTK
ncbi:oligopeptidase A, partial [bacterium]